MKRPQLFLVVSLLSAVTCGPERPPSARLPSPPSPTPTVLLTGDSLYVVHCQRCHGKNALGTDSGPPLLHTIYAPSHHADVAFLLAVRNGVRAHHWTYGNMPAMPALNESQTIDITAYVRWLQMEAGIH